VGAKYSQRTGVVTFFEGPGSDWDRHLPRWCSGLV
jgi:hypothetical protein